MSMRRDNMKSVAGICVSSSLLALSAIGCASPASPGAATGNATAPQVPANPGVPTGTNVPSGTGAPGPGGAAGAANGGPAITPGAPGSNTGDVTNTPGVPTAGGGAIVPAAGAPATSGAAGSGSVPTTPPGDATVDWPVMGYDAASTYFNRGETMLSKDSAATLEELWTADLGGNVLGGALQVGDKMYATGPGAVFAFDAASGKQLWKVTASSSSTLGYADNTLYLHSTSSKVMAFDAADGKMKWSMTADPSGSDGSSSALPVGGLVLVGGSNGGAELGGGRYRGYMSALDGATGTNKWTTFTVPESSVGASFWSSAAASVEDGLVFGGTGNNYGPPATDSSDSIIAFDWNTGAIKWKFQARMGDTFPGDFSAPDSDFGNNPVLYETAVAGAPTKMVADGTKYGNVVALKRLTGEMVWRRDVCKTGAADGNSGMFTNFSYSGKSIVAACNEAGPATLYALDAATGDMLWMRALKGRVWGRMAFANGVGVVGTGESVEIFDVDTGAVIKSFPSKGGTVASTITISRGRIAFGEGFSWSTGNRTGSTLTVLGVK
ncbi:MAG TPA: PQQ-binding-like beta-propeller repeat protein [Polyangiales bacterium]|nr:PQQ-binding-like beta-propeller repeat protein [Polyangiales bacterium]